MMVGIIVKSEEGQRLILTSSLALGVTSWLE